MRTKLPAVLCLVVLVAVPVQADDAADAIAIVDKAIAAMGGEAELSKYKAFTSKIKGDIHTQGMKIPFVGDLATQGRDQQKIAIELDIDGQKIPIVEVLNRDRGWSKIASETVAMDQEKLAETLEEAHAGWVASLVPLKDKAFSLATIGEVQVEGKPALGVRVSHAGHRDVNLFFDKVTHLLVKTETRVKDEETGKEMTEEAFMTGYDGSDVQTALKLTVKRDGELYLEAELFDVRLAEKLDDSVFAMP